MEVVAIGVVKFVRGVGVAAFVAVSLSLVLASGALAASRPRSDGFAQQATLIASDEIGISGIGSAVALSSDGKTALIGGPGDNEEVGAARVFTRRGSAWIEQAKLMGGGEIGKANFGASVALSGDGKTALIGGLGDDERVGAAWVFKRSGATWTCVGGGCGPVALSGDARTALVGTTVFVKAAHK
jgi:hypothetical protein